MDPLDCDSDCLTVLWRKHDGSFDTMTLCGEHVRDLSFDLPGSYAKFSFYTDANLEFRGFWIKYRGIHEIYKVSRCESLTHW